MRKWVNLFIWYWWRSFLFFFLLCCQHIVASHISTPTGSGPFFLIHAAPDIQFTKISFLRTQGFITNAVYEGSELVQHVHLFLRNLRRLTENYRRDRFRRFPLLFCARKLLPTVPHSTHVQHADQGAPISLCSHVLVSQPQPLYEPDTFIF